MLFIVQIEEPTEAMEIKNKNNKNNLRLTTLLVVLPPDYWSAGVIAAFTQAGQTQ